MIRFPFSADIQVSARLDCHVPVAFHVQRTLTIDVGITLYRDVAVTAYVDVPIFYRNLKLIFDRFENYRTVWMILREGARPVVDVNPFRIRAIVPFLHVAAF